MKDYVKHFNQNEIEKEMKHFLCSVANGPDINDNFEMKPEELKKLKEELSLNTEEKQNIDNSNMKLSSTTKHYLGSPSSSRLMNSSERKKQNSNKNYKDRFTEKYLSLNFPDLQNYDIFMKSWLPGNLLNESDVPATYEKKSSEGKKLKLIKDEENISKNLSSSSEKRNKCPIQSKQTFLDEENEDEKTRVDNKVRKKLYYPLNDNKSEEENEKNSKLIPKFSNSDKLLKENKKNRHSYLNESDRSDSEDNSKAYILIKGKTIYKSENNDNSASNKKGNKNYDKSQIQCEEIKKNSQLNEEKLISESRKKPVLSNLELNKNLKTERKCSDNNESQTEQINDDEEEEHNNKTFIRKKKKFQQLESDFENEKSPSLPDSSQSSGEETKTKVNEKEEGKEEKTKMNESDFLSYDSRLISEDKSFSMKAHIRK